MVYLKIGVIVMNSRESKSVAQRLLNKEPIYNIGIFVQCMVLALLVIVTVSYAFIPEFSGIVKISLALTFITMAYNNEKILKRKSFTPLYGLAGIAFVVMAIVEAYGS